MRKIGILLFAWVCSVYAADIPLEDGISISSLDNGVQLWLKRSDHPGHTIACRMVAHHPLQEIPQIFSLDCPVEEFEEELPLFLNYCRESISSGSGCQWALVAVGNFDKRGLEEAMKEALSLFEPPLPLAPSPKVRFTPSVEGDIFYLSLYYPTVFKEVKTEEDLKKLWSYCLLQFMAQERFRKAALMEEDTQWVVPTDARYMLPLSYLAVHARQPVHKDPMQLVHLLNRFLNVMQRMKEDGFASFELADAKAKLQKRLVRFYHSSPASTVLADYYASHFAFSRTCPDYSIFMKRSLQSLSEIKMEEVVAFLAHAAFDQDPLIAVKAPKAQEGMVPLLQMKLEAGPSEDPVDSKKHLSDNDPYSKLPITDVEAQFIYDIVDTMGTHNLISLGFKATELKKKGRKINPVHPFRFLGTVFSNPHLKQCMATITESSFKWDNFMGGIAERLEEEYRENNLFQHIPGLCQHIKANPDQVRLFVQKREWDKLVKYLIGIEN